MLEHVLKRPYKKFNISLLVSAGVTLFDSSGLITHGFSDNIIESITLNCNKIFNIHDLMEYGFILSIHLALVVLEVFNEIFEDVEIDTSLYNVATLTVPCLQYNFKCCCQTRLSNVIIIPHLTVMNDLHLYVVFTYCFAFMLTLLFYTCLLGPLSPIIILILLLFNIHNCKNINKLRVTVLLFGGGGFINPFPLF